jgi:hypothetical protein
MCRLQVALAAIVCFLVAQLAVAADGPTLQTAHGIIDNIEKDTLTLKVRGADGKFAKPLVLKLTGTSRITTLIPETRAGKIVFTQKDTEAKTLEPKQVIALIYAVEKNESVLLSAIVERPAAK